VWKGGGKETTGESPGVWVAIRKELHSNASTQEKKGGRIG